MRKELFICSVLMAASLLTSCGYDDGKEEAVVDEPLPMLSSNCSSTLDCKIGTSVVGMCIAGTCHRFCDSYDDCETNTICESGICRPIVDCPSLTFQDTVDLEYVEIGEDGSSNEKSISLSNAGAADAYKNKKCIQVFSHAPSESWRAMSVSDVVLDSKAVKMDSKTDFASDDFTFVVPHNSTYAGMGFSLTTFIALVYLTMLEHTYVDVAECIQPKILKKSGDNEGAYVPMNEVIPDFVYSASYKVNVSSTPLTDMDAISKLCQTSVLGMPIDMAYYLNYYNINGNGLDEKKEKIDGYWEEEVFLDEEEINNYYSLVKDENEKNKYKCEGDECTCESDKCKGKNYKISRADLLVLAVNDYVRMISSDVKCVQAINNLEILSKISSILIQIGNAETSSLTQDASQNLASLFRDMKTETNYYKKLIEISVDGKIEKLDLQSTIACTESVFKKTVAVNNSVYNQYTQQTDADYTQDERYLPYCNREMINCSDTPSSDCTYDLAAGMTETYDMMLRVPMTNMVSPCNYSLLGVSSFPLTLSLTSSDDMKIGICSDHNNVVSAMIGKSLLSAPDLVMPQIITTLFKSSGANSYENLGPATIFDKFLNPSYLWLSGQSYMGLKIRVAEDSDFSTNDLIFENRFKPLEEMFAMTTVPALDDDGNKIMSENGVQKDDVDTHPLTTDVRIDVFSDAYAKESIDQKTGMPYVIATPPTAESSITNYVSSYDYKKADVAKTVSGTALYQKHGKAETCPNNVCTLYHYAHKTGGDGVSGMVCGGFTYDVEQFNGYVVLTDTDLAERAGKRKIAVEN